MRTVTVTNTQLDNAGEKARRLYRKIADSAKSYNERRKEQTEALRKALAPVWAALGKGQAVNGCADKLSWCRWANNSAKHPERYFYKLMSDGTELSSAEPSRRIVTLAPGMDVFIDNVRYELPERWTV